MIRSFFRSISSNAFCKMEALFLCYSYLNRQFYKCGSIVSWNTGLILFKILSSNTMHLLVTETIRHMLNINRGAFMWKSECIL
jgi:hypothetical protein